MQPSTIRSPLELWAGLEGTVNRIGDRYMDQCALNGHDTRPGDLEKIASLGVKRIRYPALWEKVETEPGVYDWTRVDEALTEFQALGLQPIIGLLHHGSGPRWTSLVDESFATLFARFAGAFAERYPWVDHYTPINEPLTTARFSCLYGAWYPHLRDDRSFVLATVNQMKAITLAMAAIRTIQPAAQLVQTEDLGRTAGTEKLRYQTNFENQRRWLTYDFLLRRVDAAHPLAAYLKKHGLKDDDRDWLFENACAPDIIGINHYLLSNRYLDHQVERYPEHLHGGNGRDRYVDVAGVHFAKATNPRIEDILREAAKRYVHHDLAVTEVHLDGPRESQMRWLADVWHQCEKLCTEGVRLRAVTVWSLLGTYNWNSLCTRDDDYYESGVFDVRAKEIRPTALARLVSNIMKKSSIFDEPVLAHAGWWRQSHMSPMGAKNRAPIVIAGGEGLLALSFARLCEARNLNFRVLSRDQLNIGDLVSVERMFTELKPWAVINAESEESHTTDVTGAKNLALACERHKIRLVTFSSNLVFGGQSDKPYVESDPTSPLSTFGKTQIIAEQTVLALDPQALVVRTSHLFGPWDETNFLTSNIRRLKLGQMITVFNNVTVSPTYIPDLVHAVLDLLIDHESGLIHLNNQGETTWSELVRLVGKSAGIDQTLIREAKYKPEEISAVGEPCDIRPIYSAMTSERALFLPDYQGAVDRYFKDLTVTH